MPFGPSGNGPVAFMAEAGNAPNRERIADAALHAVGVVAAAIGSGWLLASAFATEGSVGILSLAIYCFGLVGMLAVSGAYNFARPGRLRAILRRIDHSMIFVMIAGSYTPFAAIRLEGPTGILLCSGVWGAALVGLAIKAGLLHRLERFSLALYLGMGWIMLAAFGPLVASVSSQAVTLLVAGGLVYTVGVVFYLADRLPFNRVIWHGFVVTAAVLHFSAISLEFTA